jgi:hypothetical protein
MLKRHIALVKEGKKGNMQRRNARKKNKQDWK